MNSYSFFNGMDVTNPLGLARRLVSTASRLAPTSKLWNDLSLALASGDHSSILDFKADPDVYQDLDSFKLDYLAKSFLSKATFLKLSLDPKSEAMKAFFLYEEQCRESNRRIRASDPPGRVGGILAAARGKIRSLLGDRPSLRDIEEMLALAEWGPGATSAVGGRDTGLYRKLSVKPEGTPGLLSVGWDALCAAHPFLRRSGLTPTSVPGNRICTVPKNAKTERTIAVEPHLNIMYQRGVGRFLAKRLRRWGIDLRDQTRNQSLARDASLHGLLATLDLKGASDTISKALVEWILPPAWCAWLDILRSPSYFYDGEWRVYQKWSSMGNGYTFELETLIFAAIAFAARDAVPFIEDRVGVYGDDVIIPVSSAPIFVECIQWCGFSVNADKSFSSPFSFFRESCGEDYLRGVPVRPVFLKELRHVTDLFHLANSLLDRYGSAGFYGKLRARIINIMPKRYRFFAPKGLSSGAFHMDVEDWWVRDIPGRRIASGPFRDHRVTHLVFVPARVPVPDDEAGLGWALAKPGAPSVSEVVLSNAEPPPPDRLYELSRVGRWHRRTLRFPQSALSLLE